MCRGKQNEISFVGPIPILEESELCDPWLHPVSEAHEFDFMANTTRISWLLECPAVLESRNTLTHIH